MKNSNAFTNLKNRYVAVLKKCALLNVFGTLAVATMLTSPFMASEALAEYINPAGPSIGIMNANTLGDSTLTNNGTITGDKPSGDLSNNSYGMYGLGDSDYTFTNNGKINIVYTDSISNSAYGMYASGIGSKKLSNSSEITVYIYGKLGSSSDAYAEAYGMYVNNTAVTRSLTSNSDTITVNAYGGTANNIDAQAEAYGMHVNNRAGMDSLTSNSGTITVNAYGGTMSTRYAYANAFGMRALYGNNTITNSGTITVTATGRNETSNYYNSASAYGMYVGGSGNHILNNTGIIKASASVLKAGASARAFEAYGGSSFTVGTWATTLRDWGNNDAVFGLASGEAITFGESSTGATLILRPDTVERGFVLGQEYSVAKMVSIDDGSGTMVQQSTINGKIAEVKTDVEFLTATLGGTETAPTVSLTRNVAADLPTQRLTAQSLSTNLAHLKGVSDVTKNAIANVYNRALGFEDVASNTTNTTNETNTTGLSAGSSAINPWTIFANAYGSYTNNNEYDYNSSSYGFTGGLTHNFTEQFALGGHFNVNIANSDSDNFDSDSTSFAFGAHAQYFINPRWYVNASASFAFGDSEVEYRQPIGTAKDTFSSFSAFTTLATGYVFEINKNNIIVPEIGLSYLHAENDDYLLDFGAGNEMYNFNLHNTSYDNLYADFSLTWQGNYNLGSSFLTPSVGVGVRQNLTGSDIDASYDLFNNRYETQVSSDNTTFLVDASLEWTKNNFSISAKYEGELGSEQQSHSGSVNFKYMF